MDILYILIPIAILLVIAMVAGFLWAVKSGQFDDLEGPALKVVADDDSPRSPNAISTTAKPRQDV